MVRKIGASLLILITVLYAGVCWFFSSLIITPKREANKDFTTAFLNVYGQPLDFEVTSVDDIPIVGWYFDNPMEGDCGVVIAHGWGSQRSGMLKFLPLVWTRGCDIAMYDQRGMGESGGKYGTGGLMEKEDFQKVNNWFQEKTGFRENQIAYLGESWGAVTVLHAASGREDIAFVLADSPFDTWNSAVTERAYRDYGTWIDLLMPGVTSFVNWRTGVDFYKANTKDAAAKVNAPIFLIHSQGDQATASSQSVNISGVLNENSVFHHTDWGSDHVEDVSNYPERYDSLFSAFLKENVPNWGLSDSLMLMP